ncbi:MAG: helix-turn-helix domain-containing protein [Gammaproteobacteria bacterium]|jgi:transposase, IS30 family|nr:helix-turn-helix domain-containing protein [Gammaproteobacteria bacterium]MBT4147174.1 helix-turn-helix domain-containing protein [Gammaproteobacteria bacterium]MBT5222262.1 helix-turn-helix domain-containing protein [Gammaproteobacteria bacterium]MBT5826739.1 helix-turn-helix domain-containing protein [Gammaproteobacteria bacterium]MBT6420104.1 helix-turn-helix domain-containing protein [Gammaproteobacteria bacterium]
MNTFNHLTQEERFYIYTQLKQGVSKNQIAITLGRHKSTIGREITRNTGKPESVASYRQEMQLQTARV